MLNIMHCFVRCCFELIMAAIQDYFKNFFQVGKGQTTQYSDSIRQNIDLFFSISDRKSTIFDEWRGGTATFLAMAYILAVNPAIIAVSGGTCGEDHARWSDEYTLCMSEITQDLIVATAVSAFLATFLMGMTANLPLALAPGMGLNAYFTYEVVGVRGQGDVDYRTALGAVMLEGIVFLLLAIVGARQILGKSLPKAIRNSTAVGIGLFLAHIGLQQAEGLGLVMTDLATGIELGGCGHRMYSKDVVCGALRFDDGFSENCVVDNYMNYGAPGGLSWTNGMQDPSFAKSFGNAQGDAYCHCADNKMEGATTWLGIAGFILICCLILKNVKGAIIIGILFVTIISWIKGHDASMFDCLPAYKGLCDARWEDFKKVVDVRGLQKTGGALEVHLNKSEIWVALLTFFYVDVLDTTGTLYSMASYMKIVKEDGTFDGMHAAFSVDAIATIVGATMGTSPVTTYIESADGIREGGRTGLASVFTAFYFFLGIFFSPVLSCIPPWAMGPALIIVGALMMKQVKEIDWENPIEAIPAFTTIVLMPLTYSIAYGILGGLMMAIILWAVDKIPCGAQRDGRFEPSGVAEVNLAKMDGDSETQAAIRSAEPDAEFGVEFEENQRPLD